VAGIKGIWENVSDLTSALTGALKSAINSSLAWLHNNVRIEIPGFDPPGPGSIPGFTWSFPYMEFAKGGIVTKPMFGLIGEGGKSEAVIPLDRLEQMLLGDTSGRTSRRGRGDLVVNINFYGDLDATSKEKAEQIGRQAADGVAQSLRARGLA